MSEISLDQNDACGRGMEAQGSTAEDRGRKWTKEKKRQETFLLVAVLQITQWLLVCDLWKVVGHWSVTDDAWR